MKLLILEGIATSGKSSVIDAMKTRLVNHNVRVVAESETHEPIMKMTHELHVSFFEELIKKSIAEEPELIIFDRLYLTQAFRAGVSLTEYSDLESMLAKLNTLTIFLKVEVHAIAERVITAAEHRDPSWGEYIKTKGATNIEIADYYISQQRNQLKRLESSRLPYAVFDTTNHNYVEIADQIVRKLQLTYNLAM